MKKQLVLVLAIATLSLTSCDEGLLLLLPGKMMVVQSLLPLLPFILSPGKAG